MNIFKRIKPIFLVFIILLVFIGPACSSREKAWISVKEEIITTYPFSDPDPIPVFARSSMWGSGAKIYPYFVFNGFSFEPRQQKWKVVRLRNKYLEVSILPEVGGKVWGAKDLITGKDFLYTNHVLKFREIALRGPWTSGGIEFNFGVIGHAPSTATPVDYFVEKKADGRVVCTVGNYDWPSRTRWEVIITVYPQRAYFETTARWINPGPFRQSYYAWMNAAVPVADDLKYIFPGQYQIGHDYSLPLEPWPVDRQGRDLSFYRHNAFGSSKSYFVLGTYDNFYSCYYQKSDFGFGHWALYPDMPGKKIWIWDLSRAGEIWVNLLTDNDGQYSEPQAGRLLNQSDHGAFDPGKADSWRELWFAYHGIGEIKAVNPPAVVSFNMKNNSYELGIYALEKLKQKLTVKEGEKEILTRPLHLTPGQKELIRLEKIKDPEKINVYLGNKLIYQASPKQKELERPFNFYRPSSQTVESLFLAAQTLENERDYAGALEKYLEVLKKEPDHLRAICRLAELYCRRGEEIRALDYAHKALEISMYDPEANYIYGIISRKLNKIVEAKEAFGWAARSPAYTLPAYLQLSAIALSEKDFSLAEEYARRAAALDQNNPLPFELLAQALRLQNRKEEARKVCQKILNLDPLDHLARYELYLLEPSRKKLEKFISLIGNEFPAQTYLEIALHYLNCGEIEKALELLPWSGDQPEALVWLAYLYQYYDFKKCNTYLEKAASASPSFVFPFREESIPVLQWAIKQKPESWVFRYYLGLIFWHKGRIEEARELFRSLDNANYYPVFIARAYLNSQQKEAAYRDLQKALELAPAAWRTWHHLINFELNNGLKKEALHRCQRALNMFPENMYIQSDAVKAFLAQGEYSSAAELLDRMKVLPYEGASEVHNLFVKTHLNLAVAAMSQKNWEKALQEIARSREYPEQLGTGRPYDPDQRIQDYLEAICWKKLGQLDRAKNKFQEIINYSEKFPTGPFSFITALAYEELGQKTKAQQWRSSTSLSEEYLALIKKIQRI